MEVSRSKRLYGRPLLTAIYLIVGLVVSGYVLRWDANAGIVWFLAMLVPLLGLLRWPNTPKLLLFGFAAMVIGKLIYAMSLDPLRGPDEKHYYEQVVAFQDLGSFMNFAWDNISANWANASAYPVYGLLYMPFFKLMQLEDPLVIVAFNCVLLLAVIQQTYRLCSDYFQYPLPDRTDTAFRGWIVFGLFVSPSFMFMSSLFAKDVACALLGIFGAILLLRRKYVWFVIVILYATGLRDYAFVYTVGIYLLFKGHLKTALAMTAGSIGIVFLFTGVSGVVNSAMLTMYLFISPNPINFGNWQSETMARTAEALLMCLSLLGAAVVYVKAPQTRRFYGICLLVLFTYACTLVLVGYVTIVTRELDYGVGTIGDNMVRKKLPILPLLYVFSVYTMTWLGKLTRPSVRSTSSVARNDSRKEEIPCEEGTNSGRQKSFSVSSASS
ncbi:hypothetical protein [Cohnella soli]|uniref:DUF2029 domain-containing protein n=1 Tax=Cohnella soli TaxID=425005 RepID=A0ABW0HNV7_9BACL